LTEPSEFGQLFHLNPDSTLSEAVLFKTDCSVAHAFLALWYMQRNVHPCHITVLGLQLIH